MAAYKARWGDRAPLVLNLSTRWRWVVNLTPWPFDSWERTSGPTKKTAEWAPVLVWTFWWTEKSFVTAAIQALDCPVHNLVSVLIMLSQRMQQQDKLAQIPSTKQKQGPLFCWTLHYLKWNLREQQPQKFQSGENVHTCSRSLNCCLSLIIS